MGASVFLPDPGLRLEPRRQVAIQQAFLEAALRDPARIALAGDTHSWSYGDVATKSAKLAVHLAQLGVASGDVVAIVTSREAVLVVAVLAVLRLGATFAIVDSAYPNARIRASLAAAEPVLALLIGEARELTGELRAEVDVLELPSEPLVLASLLESASANGEELAQVNGEGLAYLTFTSGTTGRPKCIATEHAPLPHFVDWHCRTFELNDADRFSMLSGLAHDPLLRDIFTPLSVGATLCVPAQSVVKDPTLLFDWFAAQSISVCHLTPGLGQVVAAGANGRTLPDLRYLFWGGDVLRISQARELSKIAPQVRHVNFYGTTETPQAVGCHVLERPGPDESSSLELDSRPLPLGKGIADTQLLVLTPERALANVGAVGEIGVRTHYLSVGYYRDSAASRERYVVNPATGDSEDRIYLTGDLGCFNPDGSVEFRGRTDDQVKVRGYRVELREVDVALRRLAGVQNVCVLNRPRPSGEAQIVAYVVATPGAQLAPSVLAEQLRAQLPLHMIPTHHVLVPQLPLLPNGKLDRASLLALSVSDAPARQEWRPRTRQEQQLAAIWSDVLGTSEPDLDESFYDLGGDSLTAIRVIVRMRAAGLDEATCKRLLQGQSIAQITSSAGPQDPGLATALTPDGQARLLLNVMRGAMLALVIVAHWSAGMAHNAPRLAALIELWNPLLNWPTPGFAMGFGMSLGFVYLPLYASNPERARKVLWRGAAAVALGWGLIALENVAQVAMGIAGPNPLQNVLVYYVLALATVPLWFRAIASPRYSLTRTVVLAMCFLGLHYAVPAVLEGGPAWFGYGPAFGKYSYFNLSAGALAGMAIGHVLKQRKRIPSVFLPAGVLLAALGLAWSAYGGHLRLLDDSSTVELWKWSFYGGLLLTVAAAVDRALPRLLAGAGALRTALLTLGVAGQLSLPLFVLEALVRDSSRWLNMLVGGSVVSRVALGLGLLLLTATVLIRRTYRLYYGAAPST